MEVSVTSLSGTRVTICLEEKDSVTELVVRASHAFGMPVCGLARCRNGWQKPSKAIKKPMNGLQEGSKSL